MRGVFPDCAGGLSSTVQAGVAWMTLETPHFYIHFVKGQEETAAEAAAVAEDVHERLTARLGHQPGQKTQLVLSDFTDLHNGSADLISQRIEIFTTYPTPASEYSSGDDMKWESLLRRTITHEYAHVLQTDMNSGMAGEFRQIFGRVPWLSTPNAYLYGYSFLAYIAEKYGEEKVFALNREFSKGIYYGPDSLLRRTVGVSLPRLWSDWQESLGQKYTRQAEELRQAGLTSPEELPIAKTAQVAVDPIYSPDGRYIAYGTQDARALPALRVIETPGGGRDGGRGKTGYKKDRQVVTGPVSYLGGFSWSPDGRRLVYAKLDNVDDRREFGDLCIYDLAAKRERRLTWGMRAGAPAWSPDGAQILFVAREGLDSRLMRINPDGTGVAEVLAGRDQAQFFLPAWSPDGKRVAVGIWQQGGFVDIYLLDAGNWQLTPVTRDRAADTSPAWSPDGWIRRQAASAEISLVTPHWNSARLLYFGLAYQRLSDLSYYVWSGSGPGWDDEIALGKIGWEYVRAGGRDDRLWVQDVRTSVEKGIGAGMPGYSAVVGWNGKYGVPSRRLGLLDLTLGYAQDSGYFRLGGTKELGVSSAPLRGYDYGEFAGSKLAGLTVEYRHRLARIERGTGDLPTFFNRLTGVVFADAGMVWDRKITPVRASYGMELRLTTQFMWGGAGSPEADWRLGVAKAMEEGRPARLYFAIGSAF
ncbi:MAG: hypothetical protein ACM3TT_14110 [Syntrophothermus sp.]